MAGVFDYQNQHAAYSNQPLNQPTYPPPNSDEVRLTAILERIERRLIAIEEKIAKL